MSVAIATKGLYIPQCVRPGGAPAISQLSEKQNFSVTVRKVEFRDVKKKDRGLKVLIKRITIGDF